MNRENYSRRVIELIQIAKSESNKNEFIELLIQPLILSKIETDLKKDLTDFKFQLDMYAIRHIFKEQSDFLKENSRGQIFVQSTDIFLIFDVLSNPDLFFYDGKNRLGTDIFIFEKNILNKYLVIREIREGKRRLAVNSMRIIKTKENQI